MGARCTRHAPGRYIKCLLSSEIYTIGMERGQASLLTKTRKDALLHPKSLPAKPPVVFQNNSE